MLTTDMKSELVTNNETDKLWGIRRGSIQWSAWVNWMYGEFGKHFFPDALTVPFEWPPTSQEGANMVAKWLSDIRDSKYQKEQTPIGGKAVNSYPRPWDGGKALPPSPPCTFPGIVRDQQREMMNTPLLVKAEAK